MTNGKKSNKITVYGIFTFLLCPLATLFYMTSRCRDLRHLLREVDSLCLKPGPISVGFYVSPAALLGPSGICVLSSLVQPESVVGLGFSIQENLLGLL